MRRDIHPATALAIIVGLIAIAGLFYYRQWLPRPPDLPAAQGSGDARPRAPAPHIGEIPDDEDEVLHPAPGQVGVEFLAHACFRIHSPAGRRVLIDPFLSRGHVGYDFPLSVAADAVLISHTHNDHDAGEAEGMPVPWTEEQTILREPADYKFGDIRVTGIEGEHAMVSAPSPMEEGHRQRSPNTIWLVEVEGVRLVHVGDNGPLTAEHLRELGRVDLLLLPIDATYHILEPEEIEQIRQAVQPRILVPMQYRPSNIRRSTFVGPIDPWLTGQSRVRRLDSHVAMFSTDTLPPEPEVIVFRHSPRVAPAIQGSRVWWDPRE